MEEAELVKKMLSGIEKKKNLDSSETDSLLDNLKEARIISLKEAIEEITSQIEMRQELHNEMINDIENLKSSINNMMPQVPNPTIEFQKAMVELKKKLIEAEEMKIKEKLDCSRDIAMLKKELREWLREFRDKEKRAGLLGELLSE